jgi:hypothetical protein
MSAEHNLPPTNHDYQPFDSFRRQSYFPSSHKFRRSYAINATHGNPKTLPIGPYAVSLGEGRTDRYQPIRVKNLVAPEDLPARESRERAS